jgi:hypothetical protein
MFTTRLRRSAALCALACTLALAALAASASAGSRDQERYYSSYGDPGMTSALAQEHYYGSYAGPETRTAPHTARDDNELLILALSISGALVLVAAGLAGRQRNHRRHRRVPA